MNCKSVQDQLSAYLDRELPACEMFAIRAHLHDCNRCREEEESFRNLKRLLASSPTPEPSDDFADRLSASVLAHRRLEPASGPVYVRSAIFTFAGVAACSMLVTYIVLSQVRPAVGPTEMPLSAASTGQDVAFEVQRDELYSAGLDLTNGVPVLSSPTGR